MLRKVWRIIAIALWTIGAFWLWCLSLTMAFYILSRKPGAHASALLREIPEWVIFYGLFGLGTLVVTEGALLLGMRGRLPGTSSGTWRESGGFEVASVAGNPAESPKSDSPTGDGLPHDTGV